MPGNKGKALFGKGSTKATAGGRALALIPVFAMVIAATLMLPRSSVPDEVPLPIADTRELARVYAEDGARVTKVREHSMSPELIALGTQIRAFFKLGIHGASNADIAQARATLDEAVRVAAAKDGAEGLLTLRAVQVSLFLDAVAAFEATGTESDELREICGNFVDRFRGLGWIEGSHVLLDRDARRAAYKTMWNQTIGADHTPAFALTLDESRAFYAFTLAHPLAESHVPTSYADRRKLAKTERECNTLRQEEDHARGAWEVREVGRVAQVDPTYPLAYARGIALYHQGDFPASAEAFRTYLRLTPNGPFALRASNFMRAAIREATDVP